ncbi:MAG: hypothetical protein AAF772_17330, partial [Acidobacteriota bacterium]
MAKRPRLRLLIYAVLGLVLIALVAWALQPRPLPVESAVVARGALEVTVDEEGETRVRERYVVDAPHAGTVLRVALDPGDPVIAGETVLARFQPRAPEPLDARRRAELEAMLRSAEAALGQARAERARLSAEIEFADAELARIRRLADDAIVSAERLDQATLRARTAADARDAAGFAETRARAERDSAR